MIGLPSGVVAFLLLDVEASTQRWNVDGQATELVLDALAEDVQSIVAAHDGAVVKARGEGDSHFCVFALASHAVAAAAAIQRRPDRRLSVRIAVVLGEARAHDGDYLGGIVNHGARIRSAAHGGQVIATSAVVDVAQPHLSADLTFRPLGPHRIADVPGSVELFQLHGADLRPTFPPLRTPSHRVTPLMAVVAVDEVGATRHYAGADEELRDWQHTLIRTLRELSEANDGRCLKLVGDGCLVGFDDPRAAVDFASAARDRMPVRIGIATGLVDLIEGEMTGRVVFHAYDLARTAGSGEIRMCSVTVALCPPER